MIRSIAAAGIFAVLASATAAQTANVSPTSPGGASPGAVIRTPPSGSTAKPNPGESQIGTPTPAEQHYEHKAQKDTTSVCTGC